jgi:2-methylisocitrate lyase-like PEP mutase family enzyme
MKQVEAYERFRALHRRADAFVMPNPWDGMSALLMKREGFEAIASTSLGIAFAAGLPDARAAISRNAALSHAALMSRLTGLPVNGDLEDGFGPLPEDCAATVEAAIAAGLAGLGIEDTTADQANPIHAFDHAVERIRAAATVARGRIVLTARADNYLFGIGDLDDTIRRLTAFAEVGADVLYAPGLPDEASITAVVKAVAPRPVNVVVGPRGGAISVASLSGLGVKRISLGGSLYRHCLGALVEAAEAMRAGDLSFAGRAPTTSSLNALLPQA